MRTFERRFGKEDAVVCDNADRITVDVSKAADECCTVEFLELVEFGSIDDAPDKFANIVRKPELARDNAIDILYRV